MCFEGLRVVDTPKTRAAAELIRRVYQDTPHCTGGYLHIVTDDCNVDDGYVDWCLKKISENEDGHPEHDLAIERECGEALRQLSEDERLSAILFYDESVEQFGRDLRALTVTRMSGDGGSGPDT